MSDRSKMRPGRWINALGLAGLGIGAVLFTLGVSVGLGALLFVLGALSLGLGVSRRPPLATKEELAEGAAAEARASRIDSLDGGASGG